VRPVPRCTAVMYKAGSAKLELTECGARVGFVDQVSVAVLCSGLQAAALVRRRQRRKERWCDTECGGFLRWSERQRKAVAGRVCALVAERGLAGEVGLIVLQICPRDGHRLRGILAHDSRANRGLHNTGTCALNHAAGWSTLDWHVWG